MAFLWLVSCFALHRVSSGYGEPASLPELSINPRIINGQDARPGSWPWHVTLVDRDGFIRCGGSLINHDWVITAAHCNFTKAYRVFLKLYDVRSLDNTQELMIAQVFRYPMYNPITKYSDFALLKLNSGVHFSSKVFPIRLPHVDDQFLPTASCKIMGWGFTDINGTKMPDKLQEATVDIMDYSICNSFYPHLSHNIIFCAWRRGVSPHYGDSGGSVVCSKNGIWTLAGIISSTRKKAHTRIPFMATRISTFIPWIEYIMAYK